jgi:hypothetical protein
MHPFKAVSGSLVNGKDVIFGRFRPATDATGVGRCQKTSRSPWNCKRAAWHEMPPGLGHCLLAVLAVICLGAVPAHSQNATWDTNPGSGDWTTNTNWTPQTAPTGTATFERR